MTLFTIPAAVLVAVVVGLIILANLVSYNSYKPKGLRGWPAAILIILIILAAWYGLPKLLQTTPAHGAPLFPSSSVTPTTPITGPGTVNAAFIDHVLVVHHSPAQGTGQTFVNLGKQDGIDPLFALGFFDQESRFGLLGWAAKTRSLGNIKCTPGWSHCLGGYRSYGTWEEGIADWFQLIHNEYIAQGLTTLQAIIPVYAPTNDHNNPDAYMHTVCQDVNQWRQGQV